MITLDYSIMIEPYDFDYTLPVEDCDAKELAETYYDDEIKGTNAEGEWGTKQEYIDNKLYEDDDNFLDWLHDYYGDVINDIARNDDVFMDKVHEWIDEDRHPSRRGDF